MHDFGRRRARFAELLDGVPAVVPAARVAYRSRDTAFRFRQDSDFLYLTGFPEPDSVAVFDRGDFHLFVSPRDPAREAWDGERKGVEGAKRFGAAAHALGELEEFLSDNFRNASRIAVPLSRHTRLDAWFAALPSFRREAGNPEVVDPASIISEMRLIKEESEIRDLGMAASISAEAHARAIESIHVGAGEWEIEAVLEYHFRSRGAAGPAYPSIVGSGPNATTLHYVRNDRRMESGDLVLIDAGADYGGYCADITRTHPCSGAFTPAQKTVHDIVASAQQAAIARCVAGATFDDVHDAAHAVLTDGLVAIGIVEGPVSRAVEEGRQKPYTLHRVSHWLGLDVHDVGSTHGKGAPRTLVPGMVLTVEPGLYFREDTPAPDAYRGIGVRIEDDILITESGPRILSRG